MRNLLFVLCFVSISISIAGCDKQENSKKRIGIVLFGDSRQPQVNGFEDGLAELGYVEDKNVEYLIRNAKNDRKALAPFVKELISKKCDLLVASGGLEADAMRKIIGQQNIPVVVSYVNAIKERKLVVDRQNTGWTVTGVDNLNAELSGKRVELLHDLLPDAKHILILYYKKIAPSRIGVEYARKAGAQLGLEIDARAITSREEIKQIMDSLKPGQYDAMLTVPTAPIDNALKTHILPVLNQLQVPIFTVSRPMAEAGALASYGAHFYDLGKQAARLADKVLRGVAIQGIPFETPKKITYTINKRVLKKMQLEIPDGAKLQINEYITN